MGTPFNENSIALTLKEIVEDIRQGNLENAQRQFGAGAAGQLALGDDRTTLQFPPAPATQTTELRLAFLRQKVTRGWTRFFGSPKFRKISPLVNMADSQHTNAA